MDWDLSPLTGPSWLVGCFMRRVGRRGNVLHSNSLPWKRGRSGWLGFGTTSLTLIYSCYFLPNCSLKIWISSRQKSQDFFSPFYLLGGWRSEQENFYFLFYFQHRIWELVRRTNEAPIKSVPLIRVQSCSIMELLWKKREEPVRLWSATVFHMCQSVLGIQRPWAGAGVTKITIIFILINSYHSVMDWCHSRGLFS